MDVTVSESLQITAPPFVVFQHAILDVHVLASTVLRYGPLPGVKSAEVIGGEKLATGTIRRVHLTDGSILNEEITALEPPHQMSYRQLSDFAFPFSLLAKGARGQYSFRPVGRGTEMTWRAAIELRSWLFCPIVLAIRSLFLRPLMRKFLQRVRDQVEVGRK